MKNNYSFDWAELAFGSKKSVNELNAVFIAAPREISAKRLAQLIKEYLPANNLIIGLAKEDYILGLEGQPHFRTLKENSIKKLKDKINSSVSKHKLYSLSYSQREFVYLLEKLKFKKALLVNGSWHYAFHNLPAYYALAQNKIDFDLVSAFADEAEALSYEQKIFNEVQQVYPEPKPGLYTEEQMLEAAAQAAKLSFDYCFQTGVVLGKKVGNKYKYLGRSFNKVVPYQTYAMLNGSVREKNFSPPNDLNHYDTVHAEVEMLIKAQRENIKLKDTTLFINLLPCPSCSRMFVDTDIEEFVYSVDHSGGYGFNLLQQAGKKVRRVVIDGQTG